ncbi:MAG: transposase family protein [candidate division Zixibacteria bacterium]|nr:transposase family protein [candidate division Zixibacteria bacterium]
MLNAAKQETLLALYREGKSKKSLARFFKTTVKTVRKLISSGEIRERASRKDKITVDEELLRSLYQRCDGYIQRIHEILDQEYSIRLGYSTLTNMVREIGLGSKRKDRCDHYPDIPGEEMQHDTTVYKVLIGTKKRRLVCSGIYLRYSKMRYVKFYRHFNRFVMKCFCDEALRFWGYSAKTCIIDNTSLAIDYGSGSNAHFSAEMVAFSKQYGFSWFAHAIGHANRKAGKERNFRTVETNFLPGRTFTSLKDLNQQAFIWSTQHFAQRPQSKTGLVPIRLFETEISFLVKLSQYISSPYRPHERLVDNYGYIAFNSNFYWVPKTVGKRIKVIEYAKHIDFFEKKKLLISYELPDEEIKNEVFVPKNIPKLPHYKPNNRKKGCYNEEKILRQEDNIIAQYIDFVKSKKSNIALKPKFIRQLYTMKKRTSTTLFIQIIHRAFEYQVNSIDRVHAIASQVIQGCMKHSPDITEKHEYQKRKEYQDGCFVQENSPPNTKYE